MENSEKSSVPKTGLLAMSRPVQLVAGAVALAAIWFAAELGFAPISGELASTCTAKDAETEQGKTAAALEEAIPGFVKASQPQKLGGGLSLLSESGPITMDKLRGKAILMNFWATWCPPCLEEMPWLDEVQLKLGSEKFEVVALNVDLTDEPLADEFYKKAGIEHLALYRDPKNLTFTTMREKGFLGQGLPQSLIFDEEGCEIGRLIGPANWSDKNIVELLGKLSS